MILTPPGPWNIGSTLSDLNQIDTEKIESIKLKN